MKFRTLKIIIITAAVTFGITSIAYSLLYKNGGLNFGETSAVSAKLNALNTYIDKNYLYEDVDYELAGDNALKAYIDSLNEPYTHYYPKDEFKEYMSKIEESYTGIGVVITADTESGKIVVLSPLPDSPAYEAGMKGGDYIIAVDGTGYLANQIDECIKKIKSGKEGTEVSVTVERDGRVFDLNVERREITENSVTSQMLDGEIGYIAISSFNIEHNDTGIGTYEQFNSALSALSESGMKKLVIDLRDNPGGVLTVACDIADRILPAGVITYTMDKNGNKEEYNSDDICLDIPIVVLINQNSASASEVLTGALKDYGYAEVVGEKSFGKGIVQALFPFSDGSGLSMTVSKYYTPHGDSIHGVGIEPDYTVKLPEEYSDYYASAVPKD